MFKVIRDHVPQPQFMVLCDRACGTFAWVNIQQFGASEDAQQAQWAGVLIGDGWRITLAEHICPAHHAKEMAEKKQAAPAPVIITVIPEAAEWKQ
jgi:hypothetical protein